MRRLLLLAALLAAVGCGGDTKPPTANPSPTPETPPPANTPKGKNVALPQ